MQQELMQAISDTQLESMKAGRNALTLEEINAEIAATRTQLQEEQE